VKLGQVFSRWFAWRARLDSFIRSIYPSMERENRILCIQNGWRELSDQRDWNFRL